MSQHFVSIDELLAAEWPDDDLNRPADDVIRELSLSPAEIRIDPVAGMRFETRVIVGRRLDLGIPGLDLLTIGVGGSETPIELSGAVYPALRLALGPVPVTVHVQHDLLVPVRPREEYGVTAFVPDDELDHVSIRIDGTTLAFSRNKGIELLAPLVVTVPPFLIRGTGLIVGLDEASFILRQADWTAKVGALGFDSSFRGVYAAAATVYWLPELRLNGFELPGLRMDFEEVAVGSPGVSFDLALSWEVAFDDQGRFDEPNTELLGSFLSDDWQIAVHQASGRVRANVPEAFSVRTYLKVPFFRAIFSATFGMSYRYDDETEDAAYGTSLRIAKESEDPIEVDFAGVSLSLSQLDAAGLLDQDGFSVEGLASFDIDIHGFELTVGSAAASFSHMGGRDEFSFELTDVQLGELGMVPRAELLIAGRETEADGYELEHLSIVAGFRWQDLKHLIPTSFHIEIPDQGDIEAEVSWRTTETAGVSKTEVIVELRSEISHLDDLWGFVPGEFRPEVLSVKSFFRVTYDSVEAFTTTVRDESKIHIELSARLQLRLPPAFQTLDIPGMDVIEIHAGDEEGVVVAEYVAEYLSDDGDASFSTGLTLEDAIDLEIYLPGGRSETPFIDASMTKIGFALAAGDDADGAGADSADGDDDSSSLSGELLIEGEFAFMPLLPTGFPFAHQLNSLLRGVGLDDIRGKAGLHLGITTDGFDMRLFGEFESFGIELDVFELLSSLSSSQASPGGKEIDVDFDIGFRLIGFEIAIGKDPDADPGEEFYFRFDLTVECSMTGLMPLRARMRLSDDEFSLGLTDLIIPLEIPTYPLAMADFEHLADAGGTWTDANLAVYTSQLDDEIAAFDVLIDASEDSVSGFEHAKHKIHLELKKILLQLIMEVHGRAAVGGDSALFQGLVGADTLVHETVLGLLHVDTRIKLHFPEIKVQIPFDNPAGIALTGSGKIIGFGEDDPFKAIEDYTLTLGLSMEYIFARIESGGEPIPIPSFGTRYDDGSVAINSLSVGYGYTKNSFAFDFEGELVIPSALIEDADTSDLVGAGIRLPRHNKVFFKLDTVVLTIGKATIVVPIPQFDIDLRTPGTPSLVSVPGNRDLPYWDGFEVIAKNVLHTDFKRLAFSPFFGFFILPNMKFDGDLDLGDAHNGMTLIIDDLFVLFGLFSSGFTLIPIPFVADPLQPYFENVAANVRLLGFELNFKLQRPFPSPSPMSAIEAFGLISNPMMKVDPHGTLANTIRFTLDNAYVRVPDYVVQMFPEAAAIVDKRYGFTLNLGTLIDLVQLVVGGLGPFLEGVRDLGQQRMQALVASLPSQLPPFDPWAVIALLPPELRKFRLGGQLAGFSASACLVLATSDEARASFRALSSATTPNASGGADLNLPPPSGLEDRRLVGADEALTLFQGIEFRQFSEADLDLFPVEDLEIHDPDAGGIMIGARVSVFGNQKVRFLGQLFDNGSFALVSSAQSRPLKLAVFGIPFELPFQGAARLALVGGQSRRGPWGRVRAEGYVDWSPIPGVLRLEVGSSKDPARLKLYSDGYFEIAAGARVSLFGGAAVIDGSAFLSREKVEFHGRLRYRPSDVPGSPFPDLVELDVEGGGLVTVSTRSEPGQLQPFDGSYVFNGRGALTLFGETFSNVEVEVGDRRAAFALDFAKPAHAGATNQLESAFPILQECEIALRARGEIDLRRRLRPSFELEGEGHLKILGAEIRGRGGVRAIPSKTGSAKDDLFEAYMEGDLFWHGRKWLGGGVKVGSRGLAIRGSTSFGLKITPSEIPGADVQLAHLFLDFQAEAEFSLDPTGGAVRFLYKGAWSLGAGLPGSGNAKNAQVLPLASSEFVFDSTLGMQLPLFDIEGFNFLPFKDAEIPVPTLSISKASGAKTLLKTGKLKSDKKVQVVQFGTPSSLPNLGFEGILPYLGSRTTTSTKRLYSAYDVDIDWTNVTLPIEEWTTLKIALTVDGGDATFPLKLVLQAGAGAPREVYF